MKVIEVEQLTKCYGPIRALDSFSFTLNHNRILGLLGQNGAGKTTLIKTILRLVDFKQGKILVNGMDQKTGESRQKIAYLPEKFSFFPYYTVKSCLEFYAQMREMQKEEQISAINKAMKRLDILSLENRKVKTLSKGQLQRLGLATLLLGKDLSIYILDEPFSGLDPLGIKDLKELIFDLKNQGKTIMLSSHILAETETICEEVAIIDQGKLIAQKMVNELGGSLENFFCQKVRG